MRDILLIALGGVSFVIALRRPVYGVLFFVFLGVFNPHSFAWGIGARFPFSQIAAVGAVLGYLLWNEPKRFPKQRELALLVCLWLIFGISTATAFKPDVALAKFILVSKIFLMVALVLSIINTQGRLNSLIRVISFSLGFFAVKATFFVVISGGNDLVFGPGNSFLAANNAIGLAFAMNVPLLVYLLRIETRPWLRQIIKAMLVCSYPGVIFTYSRGAWIGLAIATGLLVLRSRRKFVMFGAAAVMAVVLMSILPLLTPKRLATRYDTLVNYEEDASAESRFWNWEFCRRIGTARPLTGAGFDYYSMDLYATYYPEFLVRWPNNYWTCHSTWLTVFSEHGVPGFVVWLTLIISTFTGLSQMRTKRKRMGEMTWIADCAEMIQIAFIAYLVVGTFLDSAYFDLLYYLIGITIILKERLRVAVIEPNVLEAMTRTAVPVLAKRSRAKAI